MSDKQAELAAMAVYGNELIEALQGPSDLNEVNEDLFMDVADFVDQDLGYTSTEFMVEGIELTVDIISDVLKQGLASIGEIDELTRDAQNGPVAIALAYIADTIPLFEYYMNGIVTYGPKLVLEDEKTPRADDKLPEEIKDFFRNALGDDYDRLVDKVTNMSEKEMEEEYRKATS